jgi:hypothetical protein
VGGDGYLARGRLSDKQAHTDPDIRIDEDRLRAMYEKRDFPGVKRELLAAYRATPHPSLLFALAQVELSLENYQAAIDLYDRFIATGPPADQIGLARQQGRGTAPARSRSRAGIARGTAPIPRWSSVVASR